MRKRHQRNRTQTVINGRHTLFDYAATSNRLAGIARPASGWAPPLRTAIQTVALDNATPPAATYIAQASHQPTGELTQLGAQRIQYNANGQPAKLYRGTTLIAEYQYNSAAQRIAKTVLSAPSPHRGERSELNAVKGRGEGQSRPAPKTTYYLYENQRLTAEINEHGHITRQYLYYHGRPVTILQDDQAYAIHSNHLGAPIAVTDKDQTVIWRANYAPFGRAFVDNDPDGDGNSFTLNLRLPGQYADAESGLYYNYTRYYDPDTGRYIASDPMGLAAGLNTYAYVKNDPVNKIDPLGLLLFAFDGSGQTDDRAIQGNNDITNVVKFRNAYMSDPAVDYDELETQNGNHYYYITGPGKDDPASGITGGKIDLGTGASVPDRVAAMSENFFGYLRLMQIQDRDAGSLNIDIVGFSRGAAEARVFANLLDAFLSGKDQFVLDHEENRVYRFTGPNIDLARQYLAQSCGMPNLRFLGLWDTVPHYEALNSFGDLFDATDQSDDIQELELGIPGSVDRASQAVAIGENRNAFNGVSIHDRPEASNSASRKEVGFIGSHTDIGGGYAEGDLSDVALMWMVQQAEGTDVRINRSYLTAPERAYDRVTEPVVHDISVTYSDSVPTDLTRPSREFVSLDGSETPQRSWAHNDSEVLDIMTAEQRQYFDRHYQVDTSCNFRPGPCTFNGRDKNNAQTKNGNIRVAGDDTYEDWLAEHYGLNIGIDQSGLELPDRSNP